ncbi:cellulose synthase subunit BcsC-related outer membrane protein [Pseudomonas sp. YuFO8]|uniref:cellulose synthase subunit BcsC-related outer membrane protein n=1 Tax=Pseudomonas sp. YuFO8 TaxID=3095361 RepID=UPI002B24C8D1|nr:cellulose synthase subunit BcsC-related outer membrane protein [Pseudomonas sp. YuFO8]MEB2624552.1 cellulose synthase subunit BcsC-related outer membrane protein [Pseudomonas sp. YuFO8]
MHPRRHTLAIGILATLIGTAAHAETSDAQMRLVEQGQYWQARDNAARASEAWEKVLRLDPNQIDALYGMGLIGVKQDKPQQAQQYLARLQALSPRPWQAAQLEQDIALTDPQNIALLDEARRLADGDQRDKATEVFRQLFAGRTPEGKIGREFYTNLAFNDAGWPEARKGLERLLRETPNDSIVALFLAKHLVRHEDSRAEGIRALAKLSTRTDIAGDADESWRLALVWMGPPNASQVPLFDDFLKVHPEDQEIRDLLNKGKSQSTTAGAPVWQQDPLVARGLQALEKGDQAGAEKAFAARLKSKPDDADALGGLGVVRQQQNRFGEAEQLLNRAIANGGTRWKPALDNVRYWALLQQARDQARTQPAKAQASIAQAMRLNPNGVDARLALADIQAQAGQLDAAQANYRQVLNVQRGNPQAVQGLVNVLAQTGQADEALRLLDTLTPAQQAEMGGGARLRALRSTQAAKLAEQRGDNRAAQQALVQAIQDDPDNVWTRFDLARLYLKAGEPQKARDLIDSYLKSHPTHIDALYTSALLSVEMEQWNAAQATISRIPAERRTADMNQLADQITLTVQIKLAASIAKRGQRQEALALLDRLQPVASRTPDGMATLAAAYVDAGDSAHAQQMMRNVIAQTPTPSADLMLQYANLLLKTGDDAQVNSILHGLQNQPMSVATRKRFDDVLYQYRIRQADILRENGDLAAAYDTLAPALTSRPGDAGAVSALARMYASNGDNAKAFELYKPLLQRQPNDPQILLNAADAAVQAHDNGYAERALEQFLKLETYDPQSLTEAARIYRSMGKSSQATELLRKAVAIEQSEQKRSLTAQANSLNVAPNPFVGLPGQRNQVSRVPVDAIPAPAQAQLDAAAPVMVASDAALPADAYPGQAQPRMAAGARTQALPAGRFAGAGGNPFAPQATVNVAVDQASSAQRALDNILQERSGYVTQGVTIRSNDSESGMSKMTDVETPLEINVPSGENRYAVRVTPVSLNAGSVDSDSASRFGGGSSADGAGSQRDKGVGLSVAYARPDEGIKADVGTTPMGFKYSTAAGGVSVDRPFADNSNVRYGVSVSRRPVTDSVTSFAGTTDDRTGQSWGGVTANGGRAQLSYDDQQVGTYGYGSWHKLLGHNVESNSRTELGGGVYWYLQNAEDSKLTLGLSATGLSFENNQDFFTYGHGGYFSPQSYFALGVPVTWSQRTDRFSYQVKGSVGVQYFDQDAADYFPNDKDLQAANNQRYKGQNKTGVGYSLSGAGEYKFGSNFFLGGNLGLDNAQDYKQFTGAMYLRYMFEDMNGSMELPVSPYRSPYSN